MKMSSFTDYTSVIRIPSKLTINRKNDNDVTMCQYDVIVKLFWRCFVSLVKFSYWFKFHINIITGSGVMTISFYKGLTKNLEIGHSPVWVFPKIWRRGGEIEIPNLTPMPLMKCYGMLQNVIVTTFTVSELSKFLSYPLPPPRLGLT